MAKRCISNRTAEVAYVPRIWLLQLDSKFSPDKRWKLNRKWRILPLAIGLKRPRGARRWNWTKEKDKGHEKSNRLERNAKKKFAG
ncbi:hypothetical protein [Planococcus sp. 107-1]|uniref:hypothetical protein n=1 Tax=Planococcus sp. 107-1 TaxID=2908840 RepID=UPI001F336AD0|nr:hypothetical protein [Planococcus sp. 107-1]UJF26343.1 hypothetical protein L0M13_14440 [Planococcus sp. 107-1]